ncbi:MAG: phage recombination protein Bet [Dehalococcoidia bacterium]
MLEPRKEKAVVTWQGRAITITFEDVKRHICPKATDQEIVVFLRMAQSLNLNPWAREIYLIKWAEGEPASYVIAEESYLKAAEQCQEYDGHEAGIIVKDAAGQIIQLEGTVYDSTKVELVGGWAKVYRKDRKYPFYVSVNFKECAKLTRDGKLTRFWDSMPATMIRKVALARALREGFPSRLGGMVTEGEFEEIPEGTFPEMLMKDAKPNWKKFYAKIGDELGLTAKEAHELVGVESFNELLSKGWKMEGIWDLLITALRERNAQTIARQTGEITAGETPGAGESQAPVKPARDPESIKSITDLLRACFEDFGIQPKDVAKELGYTSTQEISEKPADCYREIAAVRQQ